MQDIGVVFLTKRSTSVKGNDWKGMNSLEDMKEGKLHLASEKKVGV